MQDDMPFLYPDQKSDPSRGFKGQVLRGHRAEVIRAETNVILR